MVLATESAQLPRRPEFAKAAGSNEPSSATWQITAEPLAAEAATHTAVASSRLDLGRQPNKLGNYYCYNRTYDPNTGRWTTPDPVVSDTNLFEYVGANPAMGRDPSGLIKMEVKNEPDCTVKMSVKMWVKFKDEKGYPACSVENS